ncbi:MAG: LacI family DNA-binding transcriptional regulator, partial [Planctomycetota bacterium]
MQQKEIASKLGVSPAVVSMVLHGQGRVSTALRAKILAMAQRNQVGLRKLRRRVDQASSTTTRRLAYCGLQHRLGWFHVGTFSGLCEPLLGTTYEVGLVLADIERGKTRAAMVADLVRRVTEMDLDGLIVGPHEDVYQALLPLGLPQVQIEYQVLRTDRDVVAPDNFMGAYWLAEGLLARGCRRIAVVRCLIEDLNSSEKFAGIRAAFERAGLELDPTLVVSGNCRYQAGAKCAGKLIETASQPPDAIIFENDWHAPEFVPYLRQHLPASWPRLAHMHVAMFCDSERENTLTTLYDRVLLPRAAMGRLAVRRLLERISS